MMFFESNYNNRFAGRGSGVEADVANGKKIILKQDSKLKKMGRRKRKATTLDSPPVFAAKSGSQASQMVSKCSRYPEQIKPQIDCKMDTDLYRFGKRYPKGVNMKSKPALLSSFVLQTIRLILDRVRDPTSIQHQ